MYNRISFVTFIYQWKFIKSANSYKFIENLRVNYNFDRIKKLRTHAPWPSSQDSVKDHQPFTRITQTKFRNSNLLSKEGLQKDYLGTRL